MNNLERAFVWLLLVGVGIFSIVNYASIDSVQETAKANSTKLERPVLNAEIYPGVHVAFAEAWKKAMGEAETSIFPMNLWLTMQVSNVGYHTAEELTASLSLAAAIREVYAYTARGDTFEEQYGGPEITAGGKDQKMVEVEFPELKEGQSHLLFVALAPTELGEIPYDRAVREKWYDDYRRYWTELKVTASSEAFGDGIESTIREYGLATGQASAG